MYGADKLLNGYYVIHPMGWDAFGLPAENYAIKMGTHPRISTEANIKNIKRQINEISAIMTGIWKLTQQILNFTNGHSGFS